MPFQFVRFSDGETEILESRYLSINDGKVHFRGMVHDIDYPEHDKKLFDPIEVYGDAKPNKTLIWEFSKRKRFIFDIV